MALERMLGRLRMAKAELNRASAARVTRPTSPEEGLALKYRAGDRVIDTTSGEEVEIVTGTKAHVVVSAPRGEID